MASSKKSAIHVEIFVVSFRETRDRWILGVVETGPRRTDDMGLTHSCESRTPSQSPNRPGNGRDGCVNFERHSSDLLYFAPLLTTQGAEPSLFVQAGDGLNYPVPGQTVTVHYSGYVRIIRLVEPTFSLCDFRVLCLLSLRHLLLFIHVCVHRAASWRGDLRLVEGSRQALQVQARRRPSDSRLGRRRRAALDRRESKNHNPARPGLRRERVPWIDTPQLGTTQKACVNIFPRDLRETLLRRETLSAIT